MYFLATSISSYSSVGQEWLISEVLGEHVTSAGGLAVLSESSWHSLWQNWT